MQRSITSRTHDAGVATWLLRFRERGWNGGTAPVEDARWALEQVRREHGGVPVVLLGHSMGARASVYVADDESVVGVVGLAPWLSPSDPVHGLAGRHLVAAHGHRDRITSPRATAAYVERAARVAASAEMVDMGPVGHYMFKRVAAWNDLAAARSLALIAGAG
jgi:predicted esterase